MTDEQIAITAARVREALFSFLKSTAALLAALIVIAQGSQWLLLPRVDAWLDDRERPLLEQNSDMKARIEELHQVVFELNQSLSVERPVIEFYGPGLVPGGGPYAPGSLVSVIYTLRRNEACQTTVLAQFMAGDGIVNPSLSYEFTAMQAPVTQTQAVFVARVRLPDNIEPGLWSYAPIISPGPECDSRGQIVVPPSEFVEVTP